MSEQGQPATADTGATAAAATTATAQKPWYDGLTPEEIGVIQTRGLDKGDYKGAVSNLIKAYGEAQKYIGAPPDQILRLPKDATDSDGWNRVWERLGRPAKPEEYDFKAIKFSDGSELDDNMATFLREAAFSANMTKDGAAAFAGKFAAFIDKMDEAEAVERQAQLQTEMTALKKSWGANFEANKFIAQQGAARLGWDKGIVDELEKVVGFGRMMEALRIAGQAFGEDRFVANRAPGGQGVMTREQAKAKLAELRNDTEWAKKLMNGDVATRREFDALTAMVVGQEAA